MIWITLAMAASVPVQGWMSDASGAPIQGDRAVTFTILGGTVAAPQTLWTDQLTVSFAAGAFAAQLGPSGDAAAALATADDRWLVVDVAGVGAAPPVSVAAAPRASWAANAAALGGQAAATWLHESDVGAGLEVAAGAVRMQADWLALPGAVDALETASTDHTASLSALSTTVASAQTSLGSVQGTLSAVEASLGAVRAVPVGAIVPWYRPSAAVPVPAGWVPCDGRSIAAGQHAFADAAGNVLTTSITVPDLRNRFVIGASLDTAAGGAGTANNTAAGAPGIGGTGGSNLAADRDHSHSFSTTATAGSSGAHTHSTAVTLNLGGGTHEHVLPFGDHGGGLGWNRNFATTTAGAFNDLRIPSYDDPAGVTGTAYLATGGAHGHTGNSGTFASDSQGNHTHSVPVSGTTATGSSGADPRPAWTGLLYLMRVQ